ncbi:hypothetical protein AAMO2058_000440100 [Amorphochlora amoebiformis]
MRLRGAWIPTLSRSIAAISIFCVSLNVGSQPRLAVSNYRTPSSFAGRTPNFAGPRREMSRGYTARLKKLDTFLKGDVLSVASAPTVREDAAVGGGGGRLGVPEAWEVEAKREARFWRTRVKMYNRLIRSTREEMEQAKRRESDGERRLKVLRKVDPLDSQAETKALKLTLEARRDEKERLMEDINSLELRKAEAQAYLLARNGTGALSTDATDLSDEEDMDDAFTDLIPEYLPQERSANPIFQEPGHMSQLSPVSEDGDVVAQAGVGDKAVRSINSEDLRALVRETEEEVTGIENKLKDSASALNNATSWERKAEGTYQALLDTLSKLREGDPLDKSPETLRVIAEASKAQESLAEIRSSVDAAAFRMRTIQSNLKIAHKRLRSERSILERVLDQMTIAAAQAEAAEKAAEAGGEPKVQGTGMVDKLKSPFMILSVLLSRSEARKLSEKYIGWLKREPEAPVVDKTNRFQQIVQDANERGKAGETAMEMLRDDVAYIFVPGFLWQIYPAYFDSTVEAFQAHGLQAKLCTQVGGASGTYENAAAIRQEILDAHEESGKPVVLVTHSKGGIDSAAALSLYEDELLPVVKGVVFCQCPFAGAPLATDLTGDPVHYTLAHWMRKYVRGSWQSVLDMMYQNRKQFLTQHPFPTSLAAVSFHSTNKSPTSIQQILTRYVKKRYGKDNDGLVIPEDAEIPGSSVVRYLSELDHVGTVWPKTKIKSKKDEEYPSDEVTDVMEPTDAEVQLGRTSYVNPTIRMPSRTARYVGWMMVAVDKILRKISRGQPTPRNDIPSAPELFAALVLLLQEDERYSRNLNS